MTISFSGGVQLSQGVNLAVTEYDPSFLYLLGGTGAWYDPSDLTTMFQDNLGTTPVTATGQTVGLLLDKSKGLVLGPELVTNGDFSNGSTGWTLGSGWSVSGGTANAGAGASQYAGISQDIGLNLMAGKTVKLSFTVSNYVSGPIGINDSSGNLFNVSANGTYTYYIQVRSGLGNGLLFFQARGATGTNSFSVDNISVKELPGNHATQATAASRPIYGIEPFGGRRNLLTYTEQFDNAAWTVKVGLVTGVTDAFGGTSACTVTASAPNQLVLRFGNPGNTAGLTYVNSIYIRRRTGTGAILFNTPSNVQTNITSQVSTSWSRVQLSGVAISVGYFVVTLGTSGDSIDVCFAQSELGSTATPYQRVTDQWNVTEAGVPSVSYLAFDGTDDFLLTPTITPGIDKAQVFAGVRKLSDAARGMLVELGSAPASNAINFSAPGGASATYSMGGGGSLFVGPISTAAIYASPVTHVLTITDDIAADNGSLRVNAGAAQQLLVTDQGAGNFAANPLYVGRRSGTSLPFNGRIYSLIVRFGGNLDSTTISNTETWVNSKTGAY